MTLKGKGMMPVPLVATMGGLGYLWFLKLLLLVRKEKGELRDSMIDRRVQEVAEYENNFVQQSQIRVFRYQLVRPPLQERQCLMRG